MTRAGNPVPLGPWLEGEEPEPEISLDAFFTPVLREGESRFDSFAEFRSESPWAFEDRSDLERIAEADLDRYVRRTTRFRSWRAMANRAAEREVCRRFLV